MEEEVAEVAKPFSYMDILTEVLYNPINVVLILFIAILLYKLISPKFKREPVKRAPAIPLMKRRDMTPQELRQFDGTGEHGRLCIAVNGKIFDVTRGRHFYGPGGPYQAFAGRDATRGLATFAVEVTKEDYDDISDLNSMQMESVREWEMQFNDKYHYVGRLLKPGEQPNDYSDDEESSQEQGSPKLSKDPETKKEE